MSSKIKSAAIVIIVILILITIVFFVYIVSEVRKTSSENVVKKAVYNIITNRNEQDDRDTRRLQDLKFIAMFLEEYYEKNKHYPVDSNLDSLKISLVEIDKSVSGYHFIDPLFPKQNYSYAASSDGQQYVLAATLENMNGNPHRNLEALQKEDLDGIILGIDCNDPVYCIGKDYFMRGL